MKKDYIFYGAFGLGVIALVAVLATYNLRSQNSTKDQSIDLNASNQEIMQEADNIDVLNGDDVQADDKQNETEETTGDRNETLQANAGVATAADDTGEETEGDTEDAAIDADSSTEENAEQDKSQETGSYSAYNGSQTLTWPITGDIILPYSMDTTVYFQTLEQYKCNPGMLIGAEYGTQVLSVYAGTVKEVGQSNEYGEYLILDLGNGYEVYYGQLKDIHVSEGDMVSAGSMIASVGEPTSYFEKEGSHLYIAVTKDDKPVNPVTLMAD